MHGVNDHLAQLPERAGFMGPPGPVYCDVPLDVLSQYHDALNAEFAHQATQNAPMAGRDESPPPSGAITTGDQSRDTLGPNVIGVMRRDISGDQCERDEAALRELAESHGYFLIELLMFESDRLTTTLLTVQNIRDTEAVAVLTPSIEHVDRSKRAVTELCDLITPNETYRRGYRWPSLLPSSFPSKW